MLSILNDELLPELRRLAGEDRRMTLILDREAWSPDSFRKWEKAGFDVITYRKGKYDPWPEECFFEVEATLRGKTVKYRLGERSIKLRKDFWIREVRRFCDDGHQTSVVTTRQDLDFIQIAQRMFSRWNQENYFRYVRHEFAVDHLVTADVIQADPDRFVPNPARKAKEKEVGKLRKELSKLKAEYGDKAAKNDQKGFNRANAGKKTKILDLERRIDQARDEFRRIPEKVPLKEIMPKHEIVRLETERKMFTDTIKMVGYRCETAMLNLIAPHLKRNGDEGRDFLKNVYQLDGDIIPNEEEKTLSVHLHTMANPRSNCALKALCDIMNEQSYVYPGTDLKLVFRAPEVA